MVKKETEEVVTPIGATKKTANINIRPYSNLLIEYVSIDDLNADEILADIQFFNDIIIANESLMKASNQTSSPAGAATPAAKLDIPDGYDEVSVCPKCGSKNLTLKTGTGARGVWYAVDCADCKTPSKQDASKEYPTRTFINKSGSKVAPKPPKPPVMDDEDDEYPF